MQTEKSVVVSEAKNMRMLRPKEVRRRLGDIGNATLYDWVKKGFIPPPTKLVEGGNASGWAEPVIDRIIQQRVDATKAA